MKNIAILISLCLFSFAVYPQKPKPTPKKTTLTKAALGSEKAEFEKVLAQTDAAKRVEALQKFIKNFPNSAEKTRALELIVSARAQLAEEKLRLSDTVSGIELFKLAVTDAPNPLSDKLFTEVVLQFPTNLFYRGQQTAAIEVARLIEDKTSGNAKQLLGLATFYLGTENATEARRIADKAITLDAKMPAAYQTLGLANRLDFQLEDAASAYSRALEIDPNSAVSKRSLAEMKRATGKTDEAITLYREMLEKNAEDASAQTGLTLALFDAGKQTEAETELAKSLEKNPNNLFLLVGAAYWYAAQTDGAKAVGFAQKAVALEPRYTWAQIALARGLTLQGRPLDAEKSLLVARQYGNFPTLDYEVASVRLAAGFYDEAAQELKKSFVVKDDLIQTRLGNRIPKEAKSFIELLEPERRASIFETLAADTPENGARLKSLLALNQKLDSPNAKDDEIAQAADEFVKGDDKEKTYRQIYAANRLLQAKRALPKVLELVKSATSGVDSALESRNATSSVLADELFESRARAFSRGEFVIVPEIPRQTLSNILRGRIEEITGWTLYQQNNPQEAVTRLKRAGGILPEKSAWWRSSMWRLGAALDMDGKSQEALDAYIKSYVNGEPDMVRRSVIEALYQKVNGTTEGLDSKIGAKPNTPNNVVSKPDETIVKTAETVESNPTPISTPIMETPPPVSKVETAQIPEVSPNQKPAEQTSENKSPETTQNDSCLVASQETISITSQGGSLGVLVGFQGEGDIAKITAASASPSDVEVALEIGIGAQSNRAFFVIKSISANKGEYKVMFDSPCGKKEVLVKVQ